MTNRSSMTDNQWRELKAAIDALIADPAFDFTITISRRTETVKEPKRGIDWVG